MALETRVAAVLDALLRPRSRWTAYAVAVFIPSAILMLAWALERGGPTIPLYSLFTLGIIGSALAGGLYPGLIALGVSLLYIHVALLPQYTSALGHRAAWTSYTAFTLVGLLVCSLVAALRRKQDQITTIVNSMAERLYVCDRKGETILTNDSYRKFYEQINPAFPPSLQRNFEENLEAYDLAGKHLFSSEWPISRALRGERLEGLELEIRPKNSNTAYFTSYNVAPVRDAAGKLRMVVLTAQDITERKQAELALRYSESRYRALFESMDEGFCVVEMLLDKEGKPNDWRYLETNPAFQKYTAIPFISVGKTAKEVMPKIEPYWVDMFGKVAATGEPARYLDQAANRWFEGTAFRIGLPEQRRVALLFADVTERKRAEEILTKQAELLRVSFDAIIVWGWEGVIESWNEGASRLYGYSEDEVLGRVTHQLLATVFPKPWTEIRAKLWEKRFWEGELRHQSRNGLEYVVSTRMQLVRHADGSEHVLEVNRDITRQKKAEEALIRSEKLAATGRMAATIAHEVNNPLEAVMNSLFLAAGDPALSPETKEFILVADRELRRAAHITRQTLGFFRGSKERVAVDLPKMIDDVLNVYESKLQSRSVKVHRRDKCGPCKDCAGCLLINDSELRQIISNLVANGIDAIKNNGMLHIRASRVTAFNHNNGSSHRIILTIADNGSGIRTENLKRVFEPFFTTKQAYGTGLGLWVTQELVRKHDGSIKIHSRVGKGTVFRLSFPAAS